LHREVQSGKSMSASLAPPEKSKYSTPDKTLRATQAAIEAPESLSGDALVKQQARVKELLVMATKQTTEVARSKQGAGASQVVHSARNAEEKSHGQASSPHPDRRREKTVNTQQMTVYDPVLAGKQEAKLNNAGRRSQGAGHGYVGNGYTGNGESGQNYRPARAGNAGPEMPPPRYPRGSGAAPT
jgi:hypothetical protein